MPKTDADRWNHRYRSDSRHVNKEVQPLLANHATLLPAKGLAVDLAMGLGGSAAFLLSRGLSVVGVDIAEVAVRKAKLTHPELMAVIADLTCLYFPPKTFDVICNFFYLDRGAWASINTWLKPGGILFYETLTTGMLELNPTINPSHVLAPGELRNAFPGYDLIYFEEGWYQYHHPRATARLIARKPLF